MAYFLVMHSLYTCTAFCLIPSMLAHDNRVVLRLENYSVRVPGLSQPVLIHVLHSNK